MNNFEIWAYNHMRALSAWETWLIVVALIVFSYIGTMILCEMYLKWKTTKSIQWQQYKFCRTCLKPVGLDITLSTSCPHCSRGLIVESWRRIF